MDKENRAEITSFSLLFLIPLTKSAKFLSNIRSRFPFNLLSAILSCGSLVGKFPGPLVGRRIQFRFFRQWIDGRLLTTSRNC